MFNDPLPTVVNNPFIIIINLSPFVKAPGGIKLSPFWFTIIEFNLIGVNVFIFTVGIAPKVLNKVVLTPIDGDLSVNTNNLFDIYVIDDSTYKGVELPPLVLPRKIIESPCIYLAVFVNCIFPLKSTDGINIVGFVKGLIAFTFNCVLTAKGDVCIIVPLDKAIDVVFNSVEVKLDKFVIV